LLEIFEIGHFGFLSTTNKIRGQCYKNTAAYYRGDFNPTFLGLNTAVYYSHFRLNMLYNIGYTNTMVIYCHSMVITAVILFYNTERRHYHGMAVNYSGKKFYKIGTSQDSVYIVTLPSMKVLGF
jgi:hypothetical protein